MSKNDQIFILFILVVFAAFGVFIYFLLRVRTSLQKADLEISVDQVWATVAQRSEIFKLTKSALLFGIWQDAAFTGVNLVVKDSSGKVVAQISSKAGSRAKEIKTEDKIFRIEYPPTWKLTAILYDSDGKRILSRYREGGWFFRNQFDLSEYGVLTSPAIGVSTKKIFDFSAKNQPIGTRQEISSIRVMGRLVLLPLEIPLEIRLFILAV